MQTKIIIGLIISKKTYLENDEMLCVLTPKKILYLYAKGVKKIESKNRSNVLLGTISNFEIFIKYSTPNSFLLKKATVIKGLPNLTKNNSNKVRELIGLLNKIKNYDIGIYNTYSIIIDNINDINFYKYKSYLLAKILKSNGEGLSYSFCATCSSNKELFSIDIIQGGMLCKIHSTKKTNLVLLKSFYFLGDSLEQYVQNVSHENNQKIFHLLSMLLL